MNWIPRTEREPDTGGHILITVLWEKGVDTAFDNDYEVMEEDWAVGEYEIKQGTATPIVKRIHKRMIAWMPMPKPYRLILSNAPIVDAVPVRHGKWIIRNDFDEKVKRNYQHILCSECGTCVADDWESKLKTQLKYKYCPNCGAKMDAEREEE